VSSSSSAEGEREKERETHFIAPSLIGGLAAAMVACARCNPPLT